MSVEEWTKQYAKDKQGLVAIIDSDAAAIAPCMHYDELHKNLMEYQTTSKCKATVKQLVEWYLFCKNASSSKPSKSSKSSKSSNETCYFEAQSGNLCGKHAINHLLQEPKIIWEKSPDLYIVNGDSYTQLNLYQLCNEVRKDFIHTYMEHGVLSDENVEKILEPGNPSLYKSLEKKYGFTKVCDAKQSNISFDGVNHILSTKLNYDTIYEFTDKEEHAPFKPKDETMIREQLNDSTLLGMILNINNNHYTAVTTHLAGCPPGTFSYFDSQTPFDSSTDCYDEDGLLEMLSDIHIGAIIFVRDKKGAYASVTATRRRMAQSSSSAQAASPTKAANSPTKASKAASPKKGGTRKHKKKTHTKKRS